jgi:hypothetical protein
MLPTLAVALTLAAALAPGCAAPAAPAGLARSGPAAGEANQGGAWEVVFPGGETAPDQYAGGEYARRDYALAEPPASDLPADAWPQDLRPDLSQTRRLFLNTSPNEILFIPQYYFFRRDTTLGGAVYPWW